MRMLFGYKHLDIFCSKNIIICLSSIYLHNKYYLLKKISHYEIGLILKCNDINENTKHLRS